MGSGIKPKHRSATIPNNEINQLFEKLLMSLENKLSRYIHDDGIFALDYQHVRKIRIKYIGEGKPRLKTSVSSCNCTLSQQLQKI